MSSAFWNPHAPISARQRQLLGGAGVGALLVAWSVVTGLGWVKPAFLPAPWDVVSAVFAMARDEGERNLFGAISWSMRRIGLALLLIVGIGIPVGVFMGASPKANALLSPLVDPMRSAPIVAVLPILVMWFGIGESMKIAFLWLGAAVYLVPMVRDAVVAVPRGHLVLAEDLGASPLETIRHAAFPLALPRIVDAVIVAVGIEWTYITVAEYVNAQQGLGMLIQHARRLSAMDRVFAGILVILVLALVTDQGLKAFKRRIFPWETE
jgi:ABC-type nitrate/sulfonate/bicarbonate transport system permease component